MKLTTVVTDSGVDVPAGGVIWIVVNGNEQPRYVLENYGMGTHLTRDLKMWERVALRCAMFIGDRVRGVRIAYQNVVKLNVKQD